MNPFDNNQFYVKVGVTPLQSIQTNALVIDLGLLSVPTDDIFNALPEDLCNDPVQNIENVGAYFHEIPQDQSTCDHLNTVMKGEL